jgi:serine/threonine protein phosphatase PrpC
MKQFSQLNKNTLLLSGIGPKSEMQDHGINNLNHPDNNLKWFIICDGIGGQPHGADAAKLACHVLDVYLKNTRITKKTLVSKTFTTELISNLQKEFRKSIQINIDFQNMGCTLCLLIIYKELGYVCWSGDSKLYQLRKQKCIWETAPHTWVYDLYKKDVLTLEEARISANNALTGSINGYTANIRFDTHILEIKPNDSIVLCTDGIWSAFEHVELIQVLLKPNIEAVLFLEDYLQKYANDNYWGVFMTIGTEMKC